MMRHKRNVYSVSPLVRSRAGLERLNPLKAVHRPNERNDSFVQLVVWDHLG